MIAVSENELPWIFSQTYEHLLLLHWAIPATLARAVVPQPLEVLTWQGCAWVGHDVYLGCETRLRRLGLVPKLPDRPVVTLRTIVAVGGVPGIYLLSLDGPGSLHALLERVLLDVNSRTARVELGRSGDGITVTSARARDRTIGAHLHYRPVACESPVARGSQEHFLLGGDRVYTADRLGGVRCIDVAHGPWSVAPAMVTVERDSIPGAAGLPGPRSTFVAFYQRRQTAFATAPRRL